MKRQDRVIEMRLEPANIMSSEKDDWVVNYDVMCYVADKFVTWINKEPWNYQFLWKRIRIEMTVPDNYNRINKLAENHEPTEIDRYLFSLGNDLYIDCHIGQVIDSLLPAIDELIRIHEERGMEYVLMVLREYDKGSRGEGVQVSKVPRNIAQVYFMLTVIAGASDENGYFDGTELPYDNVIHYIKDAVGLASTYDKANSFVDYYNVKEAVMDIRHKLLQAYMDSEEVDFNELAETLKEKYINIK